KTGLEPAGTVVVATARALKMHGGVALDDLKEENVAAVREGCTNMTRHLKNIQRFGLPAVVAVNRFYSDTDAELSAIREAAMACGVETVICTHYSDGGAGAEELARKVVQMAERDDQDFHPLYENEMS